MKRFNAVLLLTALAVLAGCSGDSPTPPPLPTPGTTTWAITSLTLDLNAAEVGDAVLVRAIVTKDGSAAPDGTVVHFEASGPVTCYDDPASVCAGFGSARVLTADVTTSGGVASVYFTSLQEGTFTITARVDGLSRSVSVVFTEPNVTDDLQIFQVVPDQGSLAGGEQVTLLGKGIYGPVEVAFFVEGTEYPAQILSVVPGGTSGSITLATPAISGVDPTREYLADIVVTRGVGTAYEQTVTLTDAFTFLPTSGDPVVYQVTGAAGSCTPRGGAEVTIYGANFETPVRVEFVTSLGTFEAQVQSVSADGSQISVITPQITNQVLQEDVVADVRVTTRANTQFEKTFTAESAWVFCADEPAPQIEAVSPSSGPINGGTVVTIFGQGFQFPVQVLFQGPFGSLEADVVSVTPTQIVVVSPDISTREPEPPVDADITVINVQSGLSDTYEGAFTYGENLFISGNTPREGGAGTVITIFGSGFDAPLIVDWGTYRLDVISVSGTEILVRAPEIIPPPCGGVTNTFTVTELENNLSVSGGSFTYLGARPQIASVDPFSVTETAGGDGVTPDTVTITGTNFSENVTVAIRQGGNTYVIPSDQVTFIDSETLEVVIPAPNEFAIEWDTAACVIAGAPVPGQRRVATPVTVVVTNVAGNCDTTLPDGLVYQPETSDCELGAVPDTTSLTFGQQEVGTCSAPQQVTITNYGTQDVTWQAAVPQHFSVTPAAGPLAPGASVVVDVSFCPTAGAVPAGDSQAFVQAEIRITSRDTDPTTGDVTTTISVSGTAVVAALETNQTALSFGTVAADAGGANCVNLPLTLTNTGLADATWTAATTNPVFTVSPSGGTVAATASVNLTVTFCPTVAQAYTANLTFTSPDTPGTDPTVTLTGTGN